MKQELSKKEIITKYNINEATLNNWIKLGLQITNNKINVEEIENFIKNNNKLTKHSNKLKNIKKVVPSEFFIEINKNLLLDNIKIINSLLDKHKEEEIINFLIFKRINKILSKKFKNQKYYEELKKVLNNIDIKKELINYEIDVEDNNKITGILYQYIIGISNQSKKGIYYTSSNVINKLLPKDFSAGTTFLDPACGSGFILFEIYQKYKEICPFLNPLEFIYGNELDYYSSLISYIELIDLSKTEEIFVKPKIFNEDGLELNKIKNYIDYVVANPPYGAKIKNNNIVKISGTKESSINFIYKSLIDFTNENGKCYMVLPISILNTINYKNNRKFLIDNGLYKIEYLGKIFKGVMSEIVLLYIDKNKTNNNNILYIKNNKNIPINKKIILENPFFIINEYQTEKNYKKYKELLNHKHYYLNKEDFYLGIVTGNNSKKIKDIQNNIYNEEIISGKNYNNNKKFYININDNFQQVPKDLNIYKQNKIIYKFISKKIISRTDFDGKYTINSVNIYVPKNKTKEELINISNQLNNDTSNFILNFLFGNVNKILKEHLISIPIFI